ncbi:MAG: hypothetical protein HOV68_22720 [Streptomycetaceae bacterium]|nr:hypothetical protein [Streptomycetaceae bacterium]
MRLRRSGAAVLGALALALTLPAPAHAAEGDFSYTYANELTGEPARGTIADPPSGDCVTLPEVADPGTSEPAYAPHNQTDSWATVFTGPDCDGDAWRLRPHGRPATEHLKLRSVQFD